LIQQSALDGRLAPAKQADEAGEIDFERLETAGIEFCRSNHCEPAKHSGVNEA